MSHNREVLTVKQYLNSSMLVTLLSMLFIDSALAPLAHFECIGRCAIT